MEPPDTRNYAQARVLLVALYSEIDDVLSGADRLNDVAKAAWRTGRYLTYGERVSRIDALRERLYGRNRMVDNINGSFPGLELIACAPVNRRPQVQDRPGSLG